MTLPLFREFDEVSTSGKRKDNSKLKKSRIRKAFTILCLLGISINAIASEIPLPRLGNEKPTLLMARHLL